jgi:hypothetical protein
LATISNTPRPGYVWDSADNVWYPIGVGAHQHTNAADTPAVMPYSTYAAAGKNKVLNSDFGIWQRGTSGSMGATGNTYLADRWAMYTASAGTVSRQSTNDTSNLPFIQYCARVQRNSGETATGTVAISQSLETINSIPYVGKTVTLSFYARKGANFSSASDILTGYIRTGTGTDQNGLAAGFTGSTTIATASAVLTTTWQRFTVSGTVGATATQLETQFRYASVGTAGAADYFEITGIQLEIGSTVTAFQTATGNPASELAACQRYYFRSTAGSVGTNGIMGFGVANDSTSAYFQTQLPVPMRVTPTSLEYSTLRFTDRIAINVAIPTLGLNTTDSTNTVAATYASGGSGLTQYRYVLMTAQGSANAYIAFSAEL